MLQVKNYTNGTRKTTIRTRIRSTKKTKRSIYQPTITLKKYEMLLQKSLAYRGSHLIKKSPSDQRGGFREYLRLYTAAIYSDHSNSCARSPSVKKILVILLLTPLKESGKMPLIPHCKSAVTANRSINRFSTDPCNPQSNF